MDQEILVAPLVFFILFENVFNLSLLFFKYDYVSTVKIYKWLDIYILNLNYLNRPEKYCLLYKSYEFKKKKIY